VLCPGDMSMRSRLRRLGFWAVVGAVFVVLGWVMQPDVSANQPAPPAPTASAPAPAAPAATPAVDEANPLCLEPEPPKSARPPEKPLWEKLVPIAILLAVIMLIVARLPRVELGHTLAFRRRRLLNWLPLGLTYAFLYMARYNLNTYLNINAITSAEFGTIFGVGSAVYGLSFLINGPLTDKLGGRTTILISAAGSGLCNAIMGYMVLTGSTLGFGDHVTAMCVLYGANMYFQSFGAVSIVKVNGAWFHLRERGTFGGIFGILISLGVFFAYDGGKLITDYLEVEWLFFLPGLILVIFFVLSWAFVRNQPSDAGHPDFDLGDATRADDGPPPNVVKVLWRVVSHPVIFTIAMIELCSGFLRQAIMQWSREFGKGVGLTSSFVFENWGVVLCVAGITGGMFAGSISDHLFNSRRLPVSAVLYLIMLIGAILIVPLLDSGLVVIPWIAAVSSMAVIGVHGMLSGTASADFGGKKHTGTAVGIIDGFVYAGSTMQSFLYGAYLPAQKVICVDGTTRPNPAFKDVDNWRIWPYAMIPVALVGFLLAVKLWNARADQKKPPPVPPGA
jgi:OPA family glycerol-3-phosphate transporter-like MFS transporter